MRRGARPLKPDPTAAAAPSGRLDLLRQLLQLLGEGGAEALEVGLSAALETELGGELVLVEQALLARGLDRLGGLDRQGAVVLEPGRCRDQLADDHVLLQPDQAVALALEGRVGEDLGRLLEGSGREERLGGERGLGDAENPLLGLGRRAAVLLDLLVQALQGLAILELTGEQRGRALRLDLDLAQHLPHDQLDVLVVDVHPLLAIDVLHLAHQVHLGLGAAADLQQVGREERALVQLLAYLDLLAVGDVQPRAGRERVVRSPRRRHR